MASKIPNRFLPEVRGGVLTELAERLKALERENRERCFAMLTNPAMAA